MRTTTAYEIGFEDGLKGSFHPSKVEPLDRPEYVRGYNRGLAALDQFDSAKSGKRYPPSRDMFESSGVVLPHLENTMIELIDITPGQVPTRKGIFRTAQDADYWILDNCDADSEYRRDPYSPSPDDVLFEIPGDDSGLLIEIPRDICGSKLKVNRIINGKVVVLHRIGMPGT